MEKDMEKGFYIIKIKYYMKETLLKINMKVKENLYMKMEIIIQDILKIVLRMEMV